MSSEITVSGLLSRAYVLEAIERDEAAAGRTAEARLIAARRERLLIGAAVCRALEELAKEIAR